MTTLPYITAEQLRAAVSPRAAVAAIAAAVQGGLNIAGQPPRTAVPISNGEWLLMPAETSAAVGIKVLTVAPHNPARGLQRIQGLYLLFDQDTLAPVALLDGTALTAIRTPAVSVAAVHGLLDPSKPADVVVFGAGPQAVGHVETLAAHTSLGKVTHVVRDSAKSALPALSANDVALPELLAAADIIIAATTARTPLFDSPRIKDSAIVIAVGSHEATARELDSALMGRAQVIVEDTATALREAGDVIIAAADDTLDTSKLIELSDIINAAHPISTDRPVVFKSTGMAWEDLVIAQLAFETIQNV